MSINTQRMISARPLSRFNPITGEEVIYLNTGPEINEIFKQKDDIKNIKMNSINQTKNKSSSKIISKEINNMKSKEQTRINPPDSIYNLSEGVSFVPPLNLTSVVNIDDDAISDLGFKEDCDSPTQRFSLIRFENPDPRNNQSIVNEVKLGGVAATSRTRKQQELNQAWITDSHSKVAISKLKDKEHLEEDKRLFRMEDAILTDQLSRPVMCDPRQGEASISKFETDLISYRQGQRHVTHRKLHDTNINPVDSNTENLLNRKVRFDARILTTNGRDAIRSLTGFYFAFDNSLTIYEYRQFGKSSKAIPFIKRGNYSRVKNLRFGEPYLINDIIQEGELNFKCDGQCLPDTLSNQSIITFIITDVDIQAKKQIMLSDVEDYRWDIVWNQLHLPTNKQEQKYLRLVSNLRQIVKEQLNDNGMRVYRNVGHAYRKIASLNQDESLNKYELERELIKNNINIPQNKFDDLWEFVDPESTSFVHYLTFMRNFLGEMAESRKYFVRKAFMKMDTGRTGVLTFNILKKFYNAIMHPKVRSGELEEFQVLEMFEDSFGLTEKAGFVTYREFEEYYEGLSFSISTDEHFINLMKNSWGI